MRDELAICQKCFASIERFDELQHQCEFIQNRLASLFHITHSEMVFLKEEPDSSLCEEESEDQQQVAKKRRKDEVRGARRIEASTKSNTDKHSSLVKPTSGKLYCGQCRKYFPSETSTQIHLATDHGRHNGPVDCPVCSKHYPYPSALRAHFYIHLNSFQCERWVAIE